MAPASMTTDATRIAISSALPETYSLFGLTVRSDLVLPIPVTQHTPDHTPDVVVSFRGIFAKELVIGDLVSETLCQCAKHNGSVVMRVHRHEEGTWLWYADLGAFHVLSSGDEIAVYAHNHDGLEPSQVGLIVAGIASTFVLHYRGFACLHASAVTTTHGAMAFLGPKGQGKSTMAASFLRRGATLLTDDILTLQACDDGMYGLPSLPIMKLWEQSVVDGLAIDDVLPTLAPNLDKKLFTLDHRYTFAKEQSRLRAIYVLDRYDPERTSHTDILIRELPRREQLAILLAQVSIRQYLYSWEMARLLPRYAHLLTSVTVRTLSYPNGFEYQDQVHLRLLEDVKSLQ